MKVSFVWITKYYNPGHENHEKFCILLGKERFGANANLYSLFETQHFNRRSDETDYLETMITNKLGLDILKDPSYFMKSIIHKINTETNIYYICYLDQMPSEDWRAMMLQRLMFPGWKQIAWNENEITREYLSLENVKYFPISDLPMLFEQKVVGINVKIAFEYIKDSLDYTHNFNGCAYIAFIQEKSKIPMVEDSHKKRCLEKFRKERESQIDNSLE
jgi:hypothetical protein